MTYMPSAAYIAEALFHIGADSDWEDASPEDQKAHMTMANVAIGAMMTWQAKHRGNGLARYCFELVPHEDDTPDRWAIYDRVNGLTGPLGVLHDPLLAQQVVDDLNRREMIKKPLAVKPSDD